MPEQMQRCECTARTGFVLRLLMVLGVFRHPSNRWHVQVHLRGLQKSLDVRQQQLARKRKVLQALQEA